MKTTARVSIAPMDYLTILQGSPLFSGRKAGYPAGVSQAKIEVSLVWGLLWALGESTPRLLRLLDEIHLRAVAGLRPPFLCWPFGRVFLTV